MREKVSKSKKRRTFDLHTSMRLGRQWGRLEDCPTPATSHGSYGHCGTGWRLQSVTDLVHQSDNLPMGLTPDSGLIPHTPLKPLHILHLTHLDRLWFYCTAAAPIPCLSPSPPYVDQYWHCLRSLTSILKGGIHLSASSSVVLCWP